MNLLLKLDAERSARALEIAAQQPYMFSMEFHGVAATIATNSSYLINHLDLGYGSFQVPKTDSSAIMILALEVAGDGFAMSFNSLLPGRAKYDHLVIPLQGKWIYLLKSKEILAYYTTMNLFSSVVVLLRKQFICLHAATVSQEGKGVILCGAARCGKTSLTATLLSRGFDYSSDDVTLLRRDHLDIVAFPRALNIRDESPELVPELMATARRVGRFRIADQERLIVSLGKAMPSSVIPTAICFPSYNENKSINLRPMPKTEAFLSLMEHRFHPIGARTDFEIGADFKGLGKLAERCECYSISFSDPVAASHLIAQKLLATTNSK